MVSTNPLNEIEQETCSYLINVDDMNYTMLCEPLAFGCKSNSVSEIELQRASYLINVDDINYTMLCEPLVTRYNSALAPDRSNMGGVAKLSMVNGLIYKEDSLESMELIGTQGQMEFPKRKFQQVRPATLEDELAGDSSYSD